MFCFHKYDKIENGYQYCLKCGKAKIVDCNHKFELIDKRQKIHKTHDEFDNVYTKEYTLYVLQCVHCGKLKKEEI